MAEQVKRLTPTPDTLRELFLKSGNLCAFPGCGHLMMDIEGRFIGQICHIEAAEAGGERFNPAPSNEERRHANNLMLMCYEHHVITNDVNTFTVQKLRAMKASHEAKFTDVGRIIEKSIVDEATRITVSGGGTLQRLGDVLKWDMDDTQRGEMVEDFKVFTETLQKVPRSTRELLVILVNRSEREQYGGLKVLHREIAEACRLYDHDLLEHVKILDKYGFASGEFDDETRLDEISLRDNPNGWCIWEELRDFCKATGISLYELLVELNFTSLDR